MQVIRVVLIDATPHARRLAPEFRHQEESVTASDSGFRAIVKRSSRRGFGQATAVYAPKPAVRNTRREWLS